LFHNEWTLLALGAASDDVAAFEAAVHVRRIDLRVVAPGPATELRRLYDAALVLIRPDHIVAWRGDDARDAHAVMATVTGAG
jgi:hypothetical protein